VKKRATKNTASETDEPVEPVEPIQRGVLDDVKKGEICAIVALGCSRASAARYVGCHADTIRRTAMRDEEFALALEQAKSKHEVLHLSYINKAAKDGRHWRAAAWALERLYPSRYGTRRPDAFTLDQVAHVLSQFAGVVLDEVPSVRQRKKILARLAELTGSLQSTAKRGTRS